MKVSSVALRESSCRTDSRCPGTEEDTSADDTADEAGVRDEAVDLADDLNADAFVALEEFVLANEHKDEIPDNELADKFAVSDNECASFARTGNDRECLDPWNALMKQP